MSNVIGNLTEEQTKSYRDRVSSLGLDPDFETTGQPIMLPVRGLAKIRKMIGKSEARSAEADNSPLTVEKIPSLSNMMVRQAITNHVFGYKLLSDSEIVSAVEQRFPVMPFMAYVAPDITVTAQDPLIINRNSAVTVFGKVTIKDGGYIVISVDANFHCEIMEKIPGGTSPATHDLTIQGTDGAGDRNGKSGDPGGTGDKGDNAACDCCGGLVSNNAAPGGPGGDGDNGDNGLNGDNGGTGPTVDVTIKLLKGNVTLLSRGGNGGNGGTGGTGGRGGTGGAGGNGTTCGAYFPSGAKGGKGGTGGNGGASADGGNAGNGGRVNVDYTPESSMSKLIATNGFGRGGEKGSPGQRGEGGTGGAGGSRGGTQGDKGDPGTQGADNGRNGSDGNPGSLIVNGQPIQ